MKKIFALLFAAVAVLSLAACSEKEFKVDGEFTAFEPGVNGNAQMVTTVTVKIEKGKIVSYYIDALQGKRTEVAGDPVTYTFTWNEKTKKELGADYAMKDVGPGYKLVDGAWVVEGKSQKEWFEQAALIEAKWLADGVDSVTTLEGRIDNVAGVTVKDGSYIKLAKEAVELAKAGKFQTIFTSGTDLYFASMNVDSKGKVTNLVIDTLQSSTSTGVLVWNEKSKQELGADYGMKDIGPGYKLVDGAWVVDGKSQKEWFEQAALIEAKWLADGVDSVTTLEGRIDNVAGVTVKDGSYIKLAKEAVELAKAGKFQTIFTSGTDLYFASMNVDSKGKVTNLVIDTLQSSTSTGVLVWNEKSKQELGADYGMKDIGPGYKLVDGAWVVDGKCDTEWNDQVAVISNYILDNGYVELKSIAGRGVSLDGTSLVDGTSSVTIITDSYFTLVKDLFAKVA